MGYDGTIVIGTKIDTKNFDKQIEDIERTINELEEELRISEEFGGYSTRDIEQINIELEKAKNKYVDLRKQQERLNQQGLKDVEESMDNISTKATGIVKKIGKWALAVFSVRTAYNAVTKASSNLAQYDKQYASNLEYITFALTTMIAPVLKFIVNLATTLLQLFNSIVNAIFGVNLFANATAKNFKKMSASASSMKKSLQTAGFDEMNVLSDTSDSGGGGFKAPSIDLSQVKEFDFSVVTGFLDKVKNAFSTTYDEIIANFSEMLSQLGFSDEFIEAFELTAEGIKRIIEGIIDTIKGVIEIVWGLLTGNKELVKQGFKDLIVGLSEILSGFIQTALGLLKLIWEGLVDIFSPVAEWIWQKVILPVINWFKNLWDNIVTGVTNAVNKVKSIFNTVKTFLKSIVDSIISLFKTIGTKVGDGVSRAFKSVVNAVLAGIERILNSPINTINSLINEVNKLPRSRNKQIANIQFTKDAFKDRWFSKYAF